MGTRGRHSSAELSIISGSGIEAVRRPDPPEKLKDEEAAEWRRIVQRLPADWFPAETHVLLEQYCRHVASAQRIAELISSSERTVREQAELRTLEVYLKLLAAQERESRAIATLATRMRLSQQSSYDPNKSKRAIHGNAKKLWEKAES